jgi:hypothetical protein
MSTDVVLTIGQAAELLPVPGRTRAARTQKLRPALVMNTYGHVTPRMQEQATAALDEILHA